MSLESLSLAFTGLLFVATSVYVVFTGLLWKVTQRQTDMQAKLHDIAIMTSKHTQDPDLRVYCNWDLEVMHGTASNGPGTPTTPLTHEIWRGFLHLWNTGSSTILVTGWSLEAAEVGNPPRITDVGIPQNPPIAVPAHSCVHLQADTSGFQCRTLLITYDTSSSTDRDLRVPLRTRFGFQNNEEAQQNG
jgi:hypothetical protein